MVASATGTTAPPRPEATSQAKPRTPTGNAGRPGQSASSAGDTRAWTLTVRRSAISAPGAWSGGNAARSPASQSGICSILHPGGVLERFRPVLTGWVLPPRQRSQRLPGPVFQAVT